jgi:hypothetical protein
MHLVRPPGAAIVALSVLVLVACSAGTGDANIKGGQTTFDPGPQPTPLPTADAGSGAGGNKFTDLYNDFFGPKGAGSCAGDGGCHGTKSEPGVAASGFVCGADKAECYATLTGDSGLALSSNKDNPDNSGLVLILRRNTPTGVQGRMPKRPQYTFPDVGMERIRAWIRAGVPND